MVSEAEKAEQEQPRDLSRLPVVDDNGNTVGYVDIHQLAVDFANRNVLVDHLKQEFQQLRNQVLRIQSQVRMMETKMLRKER